MEELIKKFLYTGVGIVAMTAEKLQESVDEMVGKGKVSKDEGKRIVEEFVEKMESKRGEFEDRLKEAADNMTSNMQLPQFATKDDMSTLMSRLEALETKLGVEKPEAKPTTKEPVAKEDTSTKPAAKKTTTRSKGDSTK